MLLLTLYEISIIGHQMSVALTISRWIDPACALLCDTLITLFYHEERSKSERRCCFTHFPSHFGRLACCKPNRLAVEKYWVRVSCIHTTCRIVLRMFINYKLIMLIIMSRWSGPIIDYHTNICNCTRYLFFHFQIFLDQNVEFRFMLDLIGGILHRRVRS